MRRWGFALGAALALHTLPWLLVRQAPPARWIAAVVELPGPSGPLTGALAGAAAGAPGTPAAAPAHRRAAPSAPGLGVSTSLVATGDEGEALPASAATDPSAAELQAEAATGAAADADAGAGAAAEGAGPNAAAGSGGPLGGSGSGAGTAAGSGSGGPGRDPCWQAVARELHVRAGRDVPRLVRQRGLVGATTLRFRIDALGTPTAARVEQSSGHSLLDQAALGLLTARFAPGCAIDSLWQVRFTSSEKELEGRE